MALAATAGLSAVAWLTSPSVVPCPRCVLGAAAASRNLYVGRGSPSMIGLSDEIMEDNEVDFANLGETGDTDPVGVLLLSVGAPEKPDDGVRSFQVRLKKAFAGRGAE